MREMNEGLEIFFSDLNEKAQKELLEYVGAKDAKDMNWDIDMIGIAVYLGRKNGAIS